jgi:hypothetical protein
MAIRSATIASHRTGVGSQRTIALATALSLLRLFRIALKESRSGEPVAGSPDHASAEATS